MLTSREAVVRTGLDGAALKPSECDVGACVDLPFETLTIDYEGREHVPDARVVRRLARDREVRVTVPVRANGFDPLGDASLLERLPDDVRVVAVAGHPAFLTTEERSRAIAPRLGAAVAAAEDPWVGTEGIERLALATGRTQFELLSADTERSIRGLRAAGFEGEIAVYAPTVLTDDGDAVLDAVGGYVARRRPVREALPDGAPTDASADGRARSVLLRGSRDYALFGDVEAVRGRVRSLKSAGADRVIGYPARGIAEFGAG